MLLTQDWQRVRFVTPACRDFLRRQFTDRALAAPALIRLPNGGGQGECCGGRHAADVTDGHSLPRRIGCA
jgi:hypothetical protein